jgi:glycerol-3-phosphate acyltransferase PlsX
MGGDGGPETIVPALAGVASDFEITLVGDEAVVRPLLGDSTVHIVHASETIGAHHSLREAVRGLPESSLRVALRLHAGGEADAVVSAGDTAAFMALSRQELGMVAGVSRPAIVKGLQGVGGEFWILDVGANLECSAELLLEFARMGVEMARCTGGIERPSVGLLNIGTEPGKGPDALQLAAERLKADPDLNYHGFVEGQRLFQNDVDVIVCDGFAGNIALKSVEGAASMAGHVLKEARAEQGAIKRLLARALGLNIDSAGLFDPQNFNGASLIGVNGVAVKSHGSANEAGIVGAIREAGREVHGGMISAVAAAFA